MKEIKVETSSKNYSVRIGRNALIENIHSIKGLMKSGRIFAVVDENLFKYHKKKIDIFLNDLNISSSGLFVYSATEENKSFKSLQAILRRLVEGAFGRDTLIVAIGGGITGDVAGFAAAVYMRGIPYINVPTTLLAAVDSSVGGKTGINFEDGKNLIGAFHQPEMVLVDLDFLSTLPRQEILCGLGEIIKYAFLFSESLFEYLTKNISRIIEPDKETLEYLIYESVTFKANVVKKDEKESNYRKILNFGHTIAHALEIEQKHKIKHGAAVVFGMAASLFISEELEIISTAALVKYLTIFQELKKLILLDKINYKELIYILSKDKKNREGKVKFVLLKKIDDIFLDVDVPEEIIIKSVIKAEKLFNDK